MFGVCTFSCGVLVLFLMTYDNGLSVWKPHFLSTAPYPLAFSLPRARRMDLVAVLFSFVGARGGLDRGQYCVTDIYQDGAAV